MHRRFAMTAGAVLLSTGLGLAQKPPAPKTAAVPIVVYKSPT